MRALLAVLLVAGFFFVVPPVGLSLAPPTPSPLASLPIDLDAWLIGDTWTYATTIQIASPDGTRATTVLNVTSTVAAIQTETVGNASYSVYNATSSGSGSTSGVLSLTGPGANPFSVSGSLWGWSWSDRSNLASVAVNQTTAMSGTVQVGFLTFPVDVDGATTIRNLPALEHYDFPLELGESWSFRGVANTTGQVVITGSPLGPSTQDLSGETNVSYRAWMNSTEDVSVSAGTFLGAARIRAVGVDGNTTDRWYHPDVKNVVRMEVHRESGPNDYFHLWSNLTSYALVAPPPWPGSIALNPQRVMPGGPLTASGIGMPNEDLVLSIPAIGVTYPVRTDANGSWSFDLLAPEEDDFTPASADVGSHGVLVEPAASPPGWDTVTLQLLRPDVYAYSGDLTASNVTPLLNAYVGLNGTVHNGPAIDVSRTFNVSFAVDGVEISRLEVGPIPAGGSERAAALWHARVAGSRVVTFLVDSTDDIRESDETNNAVEISVLVRGPDLSPWNVTIQAEGNATFTDPSAVAYVSPPVKGRVGGMVNVSFEVANGGAVAVSNPFTVEIVETAGLRGPPLPGWRFFENVSSPLDPGERAGPWSANWSVPSQPGYYYLNITADAEGDVGETSESNNTFVIVVTVAGPDYAIVGVTSPAKATVNGTVSFLVEVRNDGQLDSNVTVPLAAYDGATPSPFHTESVAPLAAGQNLTMNIPWTSPSTAASSEIRFVVDPYGALPEMNEANNEASRAIDVRGVPITTIHWSGPNVTMDRLYVRSSTQFTLSAEDLSQEGLVTFYTVDAGGPRTYTMSFSLSGNGTHRLTFWSVDALGGSETHHALEATVDDTPPSLVFTPGEIAGNRVIVTLTAVDGSGVGVERIEYRIDNGSWTTYLGPFSLEGMGAHTVDVLAVDRLGNEVRQSHSVFILPRHGPPTHGYNYKPILALGFASILILLTMLRPPKERSLRNRSTQLGIGFATAELATGLASLAWRAFEIADSTETLRLALGLAVDIGIVLAGIAAILYVSQRFEVPPPLGSETDK